MVCAYTQQEFDDITKNFFGGDGVLKALPVKPKRQYIALCAFAQGLPEGTFTEKAFCEKLEELSRVDVATLRRALADAGLITRTRDGRAYTVG